MSQPAVVLVVEDDLSTQRLLVAVVKHLGLEARTADDGQAALEAIAQAAPQVVLLDLIMPRMDGFAVLREMKRRWPALLSRTIVVSAATIRDASEWPDLDLVRQFLRKPLDIDQLGTSINSCLVEPSKKIGRDNAYKTPSRP